MARSPSAFRNAYKSQSSWKEFWLQTNSFVSAVPLNFGRVQTSHWRMPPAPASIPSRGRACLDRKNIMAWHLFDVHFWSPQSCTELSIGLTQQKLTNGCWGVYSNKNFDLYFYWCRGDKAGGGRMGEVPPKRDFVGVWAQRCYQLSLAWHLERRSSDSKITPQNLWGTQQTRGWLVKANKWILCHLLSPLEL